MRTDTLIVIVCNVSAICALVYAGSSGASWPLPFALFMVVLGGALHLAAARRYQ